MQSLPVLLHQADTVQTVLEAPIPTGRTEPPPLPIPNPSRSFWTHGAVDANPLAREGSDVPPPREADVCIIGSGITGVGVAYHLSRILEGTQLDKPLKVVILEARDFCSGATGRNGGHLTAAKYSDFRKRAAILGESEASKCIAIEQHTVSSMLQIIEENGLAQAVDLVNGGHISLLFSDTEHSDVDADVAAARAAGVPLSGLEFYDKERVEKEFGTPYTGYHWDGSNLWPLKLVTEFYKLANASSAVDLSLHTHTPATSVTPLPNQQRWQLTTSQGSVVCTHVVHATNAYAAHLLPQLHGPHGIVPVRGQVLATRAAKPIVNASYGGNDGFEYWFQRPLESGKSEPLVIIGGGREMSGPNFEMYEHDDSEINPSVGRALRAFLPHAFPGRFEEGHEPEMEWTGIMAFTKTNDPFVGPVLDAQGEKIKNQWISAGYSGHGMPRAFACAEAVAQMIVAQFTGKTWQTPEWLPKHYLTTEIGNFL